MDDKYKPLFRADGKINSARIRGNRLDDELRADIMAQYPEYESLTHKIRAIANGGYFYCYTCGKLVQPKAAIKERYFCSPECINRDPDRIARAKELRANHGDRIEKTCKQKYGVQYPWQSREIQEKVKNTIQTRYGVDNISHIPEVQQKKIRTSLKNYGHPYFLGTKGGLIKSHKSMLELYLGYKLDDSIQTLDDLKLAYVQSLGIDATLDEMENIRVGNFYRPISKDMVLAYLGRTPATVDLVQSNYVHTYPILHHFGLIDDKSITVPQRMILDWLDEYGIEYQTNTRKIIPPNELDIFIPILNLAIEVNGIYWHDVFRCTPLDYHAKKCNMCRVKGIQLLQFWDYEILENPQLVKSIILSKIGHIDTKIMARKCSIREVSCREERIFLQQNHLGGYAKSRICYGLYDNDELVMCMSFSPFRFLKDTNSWEIVRMATKMNYIVQGGASKLLTHFRKNNPQVPTLISYADRRISNGTVYTKLGFDYIHTTRWGYVYYNKDIDQVEPRQRYTKAKLVEMGYPAYQTEFQIMKSIGRHYLLCDAGHMKFELNF